MPVTASQLAELVRETEERLDQLFCETARNCAQRYLDDGAAVNDLPELMAPLLKGLSEHRAECMARISAIAERHGGVAVH